MFYFTLYNLVRDFGAHQWRVQSSRSSEYTSRYTQAQCAVWCVACASCLQHISTQQSLCGRIAEVAKLIYNLAISSALLLHSGSRPEPRVEMGGGASNRIRDRGMWHRLVG